MIKSKAVNPHSDETNKRAWGKIAVKIGSMFNFEYVGNIYVKISLQPWQFKTKTIKNTEFNFGQQMFIPVANSWFSVKIELINYC